MGGHQRQRDDDATAQSGVMQRGHQGRGAQRAGRRQGRQQPRVQRQGQQAQAAHRAERRAPAGQRADGRAQRHAQHRGHRHAAEDHGRGQCHGRRRQAARQPAGDGPDAADAEAHQRARRQQGRQVRRQRAGRIGQRQRRQQGAQHAAVGPARPQHRQRAHSAASSEGTNSSRPPMPVDMPSSSAMGASRPTGSISDVTTQKVLRPAAARRASRRVREQRNGGGGCRRGGRGGMHVGSMEKTAARCRMPRHARRGKRNLSAPDVLSQSTDSSALIKYLNCQTLGTIRGQ